MNNFNDGYAPPIEKLSENFRRLPGVGRKSAYRMAFAVLNFTDEEAQNFADAIIELKKNIVRCKICCNLSDSEICSSCANSKRLPNMICVVENPKDVIAIEQINDFDGSFHVLHGSISPLDGIGPDKLTIKELLSRVNTLLKEYDASEIELILATNPNVEGEATAMYISKLTKPLGIKVTRLALGIPVGGDLEYTDNITLGRAIEGRRDM